MTISKISGIRIDGIYGCLPSNIIDNREVGKALFGESLENLIKATGIVKRRICSNGVTSYDLCLKAAKELIHDLNIDNDDIGGIINVTFTPDNLMPNNATHAQSDLNLNNSVAAFDINLACSGYVYGLWVAAMMANTLNKTILLLDGDKQSYLTSPKDKSTYLLFGDAGSATIISPDENNEDEFVFSFYTDGSRRDSLIIKDGAARNEFNGESLLYKADEDGNLLRNVDIRMSGMDIFKFVVQDGKKNIIEYLNILGKTAEDFDYLILHQANVYMIKQLCKKIGFTLDKLPITADKYGNSSSATIPITISSELHEISKEKDLKLLISGFGGGLSLGIGSIKLNTNTKLRLLDYEC